MSFTRPTLSELVTRIRADFRSRLELTGSLARRAMANILANTWAGAAHGMHGHIDWAHRQRFADESDAEFLLREAAMFGITPIPATFAEGPVDLTGTNGSAVTISDSMVRDDGEIYDVIAGTTIAGGVGTITVRAQTAGAAGNMDAGDTLNFSSPVTGVDSEGTVGAEAIDDGVDEESIEALRTRLLLRKREPPQGGSDADYIAWALEVAGVTRVWVYRHENGLGTVVIRFVRDNGADIFPDGSEVAAVQAALDAERPTTAEVTVAAPTELLQAFSIAVTPNTAEVQAAVQAELEDLFFREAFPGGEMLLSQILTTIGVTDGVTDFSLSVPSANITAGVGELLRVGAITWL